MESKQEHKLKKLSCERCDGELKLCGECEDEELYTDVKAEYWNYFRNSLVKGS